MSLIELQDNSWELTPKVTQPSSLATEDASSAQQVQGAAPLAQPAQDTNVVEQIDTLAVRRAHYGPNATLSYSSPLTFVQGQGTYLYDEQGREYLDCVNNVAHLGHCHPKVTEAICHQLQQLNTNSRYLHPDHATYTRELLTTFPPELQVLYMVCSGSEANDLALRICAANRPGHTHIAVMAGAYHGHTSSLIPLSPYKFWGLGGQGKPAHVHVLPCPDPYRGHNLDGRAAARAVIAEARRSGSRIGVFICESILSCGGQIVLPEGYLQAVYEEMRAEGALCIADEVQCGFGRVGCAFWAFETQGVVPDIVTMGKPIGNGYPLAALVTRRELAHCFANGMEYFNTYGGSTAAVAAGLAVLRCLQTEGWQRHALQVGHYLQQLFRNLQVQFSCLGDVRGLGLFIGLDVVRDPVSKAPAPRLACWIKERMRERCVLLSTDGPYDNVLKLKPPMVFGRREADKLVHELRCVLSEWQQLPADAAQQMQQEEEQHACLVVRPRLQLYADNERHLFCSSRL